MSLLLVVFGIFLLAGCNEEKVAPSSESNTNDYSSPSDKLLLSILDNSEPFISEKNGTVFLKDYKLGDYNNIVITPQKYAFIDFNKDGVKELIVYVSPDYGAYMIFRYNGQKAYGYVFDSRAFIDLKTDGTFKQSEGAGINTYSKITFNEEGYVITEEAMINTLKKAYKISGEIVTYERIEKFINEWERKSSINWTTID